jgi:RimJ/RimL family protein N-acetyltransferase
MKFVEGLVHKEFTTKTGLSCSIRWPKKEDLRQLTDFINEIAKEDTYVAYGPSDHETLESEAKWLDATLVSCNNGGESYLVAEIDDKIVGVAEIKRDMSGKSRTHHVASFGITILAKARGIGLGNQLTQTCIDHATDHVGGIRIITLTAFSENANAIDLYKKHNFVEVGRIKNALFRQNKYSDQVIMVKEIQ